MYIQQPHIHQHHAQNVYNDMFTTQLQHNTTYTTTYIQQRKSNNIYTPYVQHLYNVYITYIQHFPGIQSNVYTYTYITTSIQQHLYNTITIYIPYGQHL